MERLQEHRHEARKQESPRSLSAGAMSRHSHDDLIHFTHCDRTGIYKFGFLVLVWWGGRPLAGIFVPLLVLSKEIREESHLCKKC